AAMTMQSAGAVLGTIKKVLAASLTEPTIPTPALQIPTQPMQNVQDIFEDLGRAVPNVFQAAQYQKGSIQLPMYLGTPEGKSIDDLNDTYW
ncbi:hypothetical protein, partial [Salmonella enterica]|uniref:hypothetical protein n=1 Tax=Salmonella enterica TaxID=28901 RepID=UPI001C68B1BB